MADVVQSKLTAKRPWMFQSRRRLFTSIFLAFLLLTVAFTAVTAFVISSEMSNHVREETMVTALLVSRHLEDEFFGLRSYVQSYATRRGLTVALRENNSDLLREELVDLVEQNKKLSRAVLVDPSGALLMDHPHYELPDIGALDREWFQGASKSEVPYVSETYRRIAGDRELVVMITSRVKDEKGNVLGYLGAQYEVKQILEWLESVRTSPWERIVLLDRQGEPVEGGQDNSAHDLAGHPALSRFIQPAPGSLVVEKFGDADRALVSHVPIDDLGWTVIAYQDEDVIFAPTRRLLLLIFAFFLVALAALAIVGWVWYRTLFNYAEDLRRSNKELENFCYSIAHDLRAPLRSMQGFTTMLMEDYGSRLDEHGKDCARRIVNSSQRMDHLIGDLLDYGSISHTNLEFHQVDLEDALDRAVDRISARLHQIDGQLEIKKPLGTVSADRIILIAILQQLLSNALKFRKPDTPPHVEVWSEIRNGFVRLWIKDNGIGIPKDHQEKIFGVFQRLHRADAYSGTGIGLAIVKKGVERMGGDAGLESEVGQGSAFWIELPRN